ncbi:MAG: DUF2169 domain-containing protein [Polyangiaceae bacterium]
MDEARLDNRTEFAAYPQMLLDVDGEKLVTVVKATFEVKDGDLELAPPERMRPVRQADIPWGEPEISSIAYPADLCLRKPGTDVVVVGCAHAPGGVPVPRIDVRVEVGRLKKSLAVFGPRVWQSATSFSAPTPFSELELRYEYAFGGFDDSDPENVVEEPRNPIGSGKVAVASARIGTPAPRIEDPAALLDDLGVDPKPTGVGALGRHWAPRRDHVGTYDAIWSETQCPLLPTDFDDRHHLCAAPDLIARPPLVGGEQVSLLNLLPGGGVLQLTLPKIEVALEFRVEGREPVRFTPHLDTVLVDTLLTGPDKPPAIELCWRAHVVAPRRLKAAKIIVTERDVP